MPASSSASFSSTSGPPRHPPRLRLSISPLSTLPTRRQALCQFPSSVRTPVRQPASCPAQCTPLDLNVRTTQPSVHRKPAQLNNIAKPQPTNYPTQCTPLNLNNQIKYQKIYQIEYQIKYQKKIE